MLNYQRVLYNSHPALRPLKPCFTVGLTPGPKPLVVVGISSDFFQLDRVCRLPSWSPCFPNRVLSQHGVWRGMVQLYNTPLSGTFAGKTYDNTMRLRLLRKLLLDKANMPPMSKTTHFPEAGLSVLLDLQYCQLYSTASWMTKYASWMTKYAAEICRALLPNCYLQHYCTDSVSCF